MAIEEKKKHDDDREKVVKKIAMSRSNSNGIEMNKKTCAFSTWLSEREALYEKMFINVVEVHFFLLLLNKETYLIALVEKASVSSFFFGDSDLVTQFIFSLNDYHSRTLS